MKKILLCALAALICTGSAAAEEKVLWQTGDQALEGDGFVKEAYTTGLIVAPEAFEGINAGARLYIDITASGWAELYLKNYDKAQIWPSTAINSGVATQVLTNFQLEQIRKGGFRIDGSSALEITKVRVDTDAYTGNFENSIWIGRQVFTADWGGNVTICPLEASTLAEGDQLKVYYTKDAESISVMVNYIDSNGKQVDYYPTWTYDDLGASFIIAPDFIGFLKTNNKGFVVKGASITVSKVDLIKKSTSSVADVAVDADAPVNVYNAAGQLLYSNVIASDIIPNLPAGFYIIGGKKHIVK